MKFAINSLFDRVVRLCRRSETFLSIAWEITRREGLRGIKRGLIRMGDTSRRNPIMMILRPEGMDYIEWTKRYDTFSSEDLASLRAHSEDLSSKPLISVIMPTFNPNLLWLKEAIDSVRTQAYSNWELCIADDASTTPGLRQILERYSIEDPRIKVVFREVNGHISESSNSAVTLATGEWIALLDHDDLLRPHALFWVAKTIIENPDSQMIYSDEEKISETGRRSNPYFKSDWNQDLFYSHNMFSHLGVYRADLLRAVGGFRKGMEGSQDYDLALRCIEKIDPSRICHIPRVLYSWRIHGASTASSTDAKPYAALAGERALNEHFLRQGWLGKVQFLGFGYRATYTIPTPAPLVTVIIPTRDQVELLRRCVNSIFDRTNYLNFEVLIVDNNSVDLATLEYFEELKKLPNCRVLIDRQPFNYPALNNSAAQAARGEVLLLLNNDTEVLTAGWMTEMVSHALRPDVGAVGAKLWYPNSTLQHGGVILGVGGVASHAHKGIHKGHLGYFGRANLIQSFSAVTAACLAVRRESYLRIGGMDEKNLSFKYSDIDFCLRLREIGLRTIWTPFAELIHHEAALRGSDLDELARLRLDKEASFIKRRWGEVLAWDPSYNPNLTLDAYDFSYAWPPRMTAIPLHCGLGKRKGR